MLIALSDSDVWYSVTEVVGGGAKTCGINFDPLAGSRSASPS